MATMLDRLREGLIWGYAALTLAEEQRLKRRQWWEQERVRVKEEARARLDSVLQEIEERRAQRQDWMRRRVRDRLSDTGIVTTDELPTLEAKIDALVAKVDQLRGQGTSSAIPIGDQPGASSPIATPASDPAEMASIPPAPDIPSVS